jgi:hypothetical protein
MTYKLIKEYPNCSIKLGGKVHRSTLGMYIPETTIESRAAFSKYEIENHPEFWKKVETEKTYSDSIMAFANALFASTLLAIEESPTIEEVMQECIRRFPKGSKVKSATNGEIHTICTKQFIKPKKDDWFEGVYYYGCSNSIYAVIEGKTKGFCLYNRGKYAELVEEPKQDWEITYFKNNGRTIGVLDDKAFSGLLLKEFLIDEESSIHSIRIKSDGEVFTVGDRTNEGVIKEFQYCKDGRLIISFVDGLPRYLDAKGSTHKLSKLKPLLKTEDGVDIYEGDYYFSVLKKDLIYNGRFVAEPINGGKFSNPESCIIFSTKEAAEEYILLNKPCLSYNNIMEAYKDLNLSGTYLKELVKSKNI